MFFPFKLLRDADRVGAAMRIFGNTVQLPPVIVIFRTEPPDTLAFAVGISLHTPPTRVTSGVVI